jgi:SAM-dependent methyltransferase
MPTCPLCRADVSPTRSLSRDSIAAALCPPARDAARFERMRREVVRLWPEGEVEICVCTTCGLGFASPLVEGDASFYALLHERTGYASDRWEFRETLRRFGGRAKRVLDVGAGAGDFLKALPTTVEKHAVEASDTLCAGLAAAGIVAHRELDAAPADCDLVAMFHVIQYFADPVGALRRAASHLSPSGRLVLSAPNAPVDGSLDDLRSPPHPLTRWSETAIRSAAREAGLDVELRLFIPKPLSALPRVAHGRAGRSNGIVFQQIDAMASSRLRDALLILVALPRLPGVMLKSRRLLGESQLYLVLRRTVRTVVDPATTEMRASDQPIDQTTDQTGHQTRSRSV